MRRLLLLLITATVASKAGAGTIVPVPANQPVQISAQLDKTHFAVDEPVDVTVTVTNTGQKEVWLGGTAQELSTFRFTLKDAEGHEIKPTEFGKQVTSPLVTAFSNAPVPLPPGQKRYVVFPLRRMFYAGEGGTFSLVVSRGIPLEPVEIAPKQYRFDWYTLPAEPIRFSVSPPEVPHDLTFGGQLLAATRLENQRCWNEKPVWVNLNTEGGRLPELEVAYLGRFWPQFREAPRAVPVTSKGGTLMAKISASKRPTRLDLARVFDLSLPGKYVLKVVPAQGAPRELYFQMLGVSPYLYNAGFVTSVSREERLTKRVGLLQPHALDAQGNAIMNPEIF